MIKKTIKTLVIDDTVIYRKIVKDIANEFEHVEVIGTAPNGKIALQKIRRNKPDLVISDIEMPVMDGLETLKVIKKEFPEIAVIMVSSLNQRQANITVKALSMGATDFVAKPREKGLESNYKKLKKDLAPIISIFLEKFKIESSKPVKRKEPRKPTKIKKRTKARFPRLKLTPTKFDIIVIGVSTGGPKALESIIPKLPANIDLPILLVQHMPPMFTKSLANHLDSKSKLKVCEAVDGECIEKNTVYIAPGGQHMVVRNNGTTPIIGLTDTPPVNSCKPSVDVLFKSIPTAYNKNILSIILTGMGSDGYNGVKKLKRYNAYTLTQSADSCVVYGMPRKIDEEDLSDESIHLDNFAKRITKLLKK